MTSRYLHALLFVLLFQLVGGLNGALTSADMGWYATIDKSPLTPPGWLFPIAWTSLYILMGLAAWRVFLVRDRWLLILFCALTVLNWTWSALFFTLHMTGLSFASIMVQNALTLALILMAWRTDRMISLCLTPLLCWTCFAAYLNGYIWWVN